MYYIPVGEEVIYNCPMCPLKQGRHSVVKCEHIFAECPLVKFPNRDEARIIVMNMVSDNKTIGQMLDEMGFKETTKATIT